MPPSSHDAARELFSSGRLAEAELAWRRILERSPADPEALHTLGWILAQTGREPEGLALIDRSIDCEPRNAAMRGNRAAVLHSLGRDEEALRDLRRALDLDARLPAPLNLLGNIHLAAGRLDEARAAYRRALALDASMPEAHVGLGLVHVRHDDPAGARACFEAALGLDPGHAPAHFNLGVLCEAQGDDKRAERSYRLALERTPDDWQSLNNLGVLLRRTGREPEARDCLERALAAAPRQPDVLNNAGLSLQRAGRAQEAIARYELAVGQRPGFAHALVNWGNALQDLGSLDDARTRYEQAASASPGFPEARYGLAQVALRQRRFREGWELYEARFETRPPLSLRRELPLPRLEAGDLGRARRVAVWSEQGLGDQLLYSTLLGELERRGIGAVVEVDARLAPAYRRALPGMQFTIPAESAQAFLGCDFQVPIASLPRLFRNETADFARQPRALLTADPGRLAAARAALGPGRWIGIAWRSLQGGEREPVARRKSAPLEAFAALAAAGVRLLDLQYGDLREERDAFEARHRGLLTRIAQLDVFADLEGVLAAIAACEGVVTTSNVLAHLAGALGAPTRLIYLAGREPFHYWVPGADGRSPWYPSVEIVTDQAWTSWEPVLVAVASRLR